MDYIAFGRVYPERASFRLSKRKLAIHGHPADILIHNSQIVMRFDPPDDIDPFTIRNLLRKAARTQIDVYGFLEGRSYEVEITALLNEDEEFVFEREIPSLIGDADERREEYEQKITEIFTTPAGSYLQLALQDFNLAIRDPNETGFACYRAIESLRKHIHEIESIPDDDDHRKEAWSRLHELTGTDSEEIIELQKKFANERRHGGENLLSDEDRQEIFSVTEDALCRYIDFLYDRMQED